MNDLIRASLSSLFCCANSDC